MDGFGFGWIFMTLWWVLIIVGIVALVKWLMSSGAGGRDGGDGRALDILRERYARGEIDQEEYEKRRRDLER